MKIPISKTHSFSDRFKLLATNRFIYFFPIPSFLFETDSNHIKFGFHQNRLKPHSRGTFKSRLDDLTLPSTCRCHSNLTDRLKTWPNLDRGRSHLDVPPCPP